MNRSTETEIVATIQQIFADSGRPAAENIRMEDRLVDTLQLDSLDLAVLVVQLEQKLGVDPFRQGATAIPTVGELIRLYESSLDSTSTGDKA